MDTLQLNKAKRFRLTKVLLAVLSPTFSSSFDPQTLPTMPCNHSGKCEKSNVS